MFTVTVTLTFDLKINKDHLWVMAIHNTKKGLPRCNKFEVNERTRLCQHQTDDMRHNIIRPKVLLDV